MNHYLYLILCIKLINIWCCTWAVNAIVEFLKQGKIFMIVRKSLYEMLGGCLEKVKT